MKFRRQGIVILMCLLTTSLLVGCKVMDDQQREDRLKELLRDKYGEEFEVREMYVTGGVEAWCYLVDNPDVIFTIETTLDMDNISADDYLQTIVEHQLNDEMQVVADKFFSKSLISVNIPLGATNGYQNYKSEGIDCEKLLEYIRSNNYSSDITVNMFIKGEKYDIEYQVIHEIYRILSDYNVRRTYFVIYICDDQDIVKAQDAIAELGWHSIGDTTRMDIYKVKKEFKYYTLYFDENAKPYIYDSKTDEEKLMDITIYKEIREEE